MLFTKRLQQLVALFIGVVAFSTYSLAGLQVDAQSGMLFGVDDNKQHIATRPGIKTGGTLYGSFELVPHLSLLLYDDLRSYAGFGSKAITDSVLINEYAMQERSEVNVEQKIPSYNDGGVRVRLDGFGALELGYRNIFYGKSDYFFVADNYFPSYFDVDARANLAYKNKMRHSIDGSYQFKADVLQFSAATNLFTHELSFGTLERLEAAGVTVPVSTGFYTAKDQTLYTGLEGGITIPGSAVAVLLGTRQVINLNRPKIFNSSRNYLLLRGEGEFFDNRFSYQARSEVFGQEYLADSVFAWVVVNDVFEKVHKTTGFFETVYLRDSYTVADGLYLKGLVIYTLGMGKKMVTKQRFEFALRKAWRNESSVEMGYFSTSGVLFPMQGQYLRTTIRPIEMVGVVFNVKNVWAWPENWKQVTNKTEYLKTVGSLECSFRLAKPFEIYVGGDAIAFNPNVVGSSFPSRIGGWGGARVCLQ